MSEKKIVTDRPIFPSEEEPQSDNIFTVLKYQLNLDKKSKKNTYVPSIKKYGSPLQQSESEENKLSSIKAIESDAILKILKNKATALKNSFSESKNNNEKVNEPTPKKGFLPDLKPPKDENTCYFKTPSSKTSKPYCIEISQKSKELFEIQNIPLLPQSEKYSRSPMVFPSIIKKTNKNEDVSSKKTSSEKPEKIEKIERNEKIGKDNENINNVLTIPNIPIIKRKKKKATINPEQKEKNIKDVAFALKYNSYVDFLMKIALSNNILLKIPNQYFSSYKIYIGKGNNSPLIRLIMQQRWWWTVVDNFDENVNFVWTQLKYYKFLHKIKNHSQKKYNYENAIKSEIDSDTNSECELENSLITKDLFQRSSSFCRKKKEAPLSENHRSYTNYEKKLKSAEKSKRNDISSKAIEKSGQKKKKEKKEKSKMKKKISDLSLRKIINGNDYYSLINLNSKHTNLDNASADELTELYRKIRLNTDFNIFDNNFHSFKLHNHLENNFNLSNKKGMFYNMRYYYTSIQENVFDHLPVTFHIQNGLKDNEYKNFLDFYNKKNEEKASNIWIIKPGEMTNRGTGIDVCNDLQQIKEIIDGSETHPNGKPKTYIVQLYLDRPLLYHKRKFDIRCYLLLTSINGILKGYWYQEGYIRTSSKEFTLKNITNKLIHLTNDAVQKKSDDYGKFESGNKVSYLDFQKYLDSTDQKVSFMNDIYPKMKKTAADAVKSVYPHIDPNKRDFCFEVFGLDFMIDENYKEWLIEINTNPCLELSSALLARLIPNMLENAFRIAVDSIFPPPDFSSWNVQKKPFIPEDMMEYNRFELIFDEIADGPLIRNLRNKKEENRDQIYEIEEEEKDYESDQEREIIPK